MLTFNIILAVAAQAAVSTPAQSASPAPVPNVDVVGPQTRVICRTITPSGSHITARRVCQTVAQAGAERDRAQDEADRDVRSTMRRTNEMLEQSGYGNWLRAHSGPGVSETSLGATRRRGE